MNWTTISTSWNIVKLWSMVIAGGSLIEEVKLILLIEWNGHVWSLGDGGDCICCGDSSHRRCVKWLLSSTHGLLDWKCITICHPFTDKIRLLYLEAAEEVCERRVANHKKICQGMLVIICSWMKGTRCWVCKVDKHAISMTFSFPLPPAGTAIATHRYATQTIHRCALILAT